MRLYRAGLTRSRDRLVKEFEQSGYQSSRPVNRHNHSESVSTEESSGRRSLSKREQSTQHRRDASTVQTELGTQSTNDELNRATGASHLSIHLQTPIPQFALSQIRSIINQSTIVLDSVTDTYRHLHDELNVIVTVPRNAYHLMPYRFTHKMPLITTPEISLPELLYVFNCSFPRTVNSILSLTPDTTELLPPFNRIPSITLMLCLLLGYFQRKRNLRLSAFFRHMLPTLFLFPPSIMHGLEVLQLLTLSIARNEDDGGVVSVVLTTSHSITITSNVVIDVTCSSTADKGGAVFVSFDASSVTLSIDWCTFKECVAADTSSVVSRRTEEIGTGSISFDFTVDTDKDRLRSIWEVIQRSTQRSSSAIASLVFSLSPHAEAREALINVLSAGSLPLTNIEFRATTHLTFLSSVSDPVLLLLRSDEILSQTPDNLTRLVVSNVQPTAMEGLTSESSVSSFGTLFIDSSEVSLTNCSFTDNTARYAPFPSVNRNLHYSSTTLTTTEGDWTTPESLWMKNDDCDVVGDWYRNKSPAVQSPNQNHTGVNTAMTTAMDDFELRSMIIPQAPASQKTCIIRPSEVMDDSLIHIPVATGRTRL
ncbi:hypothetical protein BLNAU_21545 [Blattamonas nauphoetae]|uniref:Uncharacterized protein n=1 Tax=Blattamonas nauphoetae TaxID=2049346 RepID=A0ABQ9WW22_9EUKA|nr:hypothetical protein BLNAU_21545 [Blattamonas nauphoetae]